jgi:hypothetical protein
MADSIGVYTSSAAIHTGKGQLTGVVISTSAAAGTATFYDHDEASGTKILEVIVAAGHPAIIFFAERFAPRSAIGLYIALGANMTATVWSVQL